MRGCVASASAHVEQALAAVGQRAGLGPLDAGERRDSASASAVSAFTSRDERARRRHGSKRLGARACTARRMFSSTDSAGNRLVIWNERPTPAARDLFGREARDRASAPASPCPASGANMPEIRLKAVVLPAPFGPISACSVRSAHGDVDVLRRPGCRRSCFAMPVGDQHRAVDCGRRAGARRAAALGRGRAARHRGLLDRPSAERRAARARRRRRGRSARTR